MKKILMPAMFIAGVGAGFYAYSQNISDTRHTFSIATANVLQSGSLIGEKTSEQILELDVMNPQNSAVFSKGIQNFVKLSPTQYQILFPQGSYVPSAKNAPAGGVTFISHLENPEVLTKMLEYEITFGEDFDFVKGGKLPGLCGGSCPRGGSEKEDGFSTRFMWRKGGALELYPYLPSGTDTKYGESIVVPGFQFVAGRKYKLSQKITLNTVGKSDGTFEIFIDGISVLKREGVLFRNSEEVKIDSLLFALFFGGNDTSFAAKKDENIMIENVKVVNY